MAKGLRSKSKRAFKSIRRQQIHAPVELARTIRLAALQEAAGVTPTTQECDVMECEDQGSLNAVNADSTTMEMETGETSGVNLTKNGEESKISTSSHVAKSDHQYWLSRNQQKKLKKKAKQLKRAGKTGKQPAKGKKLWF